MDYHFAIKFRDSAELLVKMVDSDLARDWLVLFHENLVRSKPLLRDQGAYSLDRMRELAEQCRDILGWDWIRDRYDDYAVTTRMHKDIETYLARGFSNVPQEHDAILHELHICLHSTQLHNQRTTMQLEWFNNDGFSMQDYDFEFTHDSVLGSIMLQNPYVGHPPDWIWQQNDHTNVWQTCRFHDFVRPGMVIDMQGNLEKTTTAFDRERYLGWWRQHAPDFLEFHGQDKMLANTGRPVIGHVVNNHDMTELQHRKNIQLTSVRFNPDLDLTPVRYKPGNQNLLSEVDYNNIRGQDWPVYEQFLELQDPPDWILQEIVDLTGIDYAALLSSRNSPGQGPYCFEWD